MARARARVIHAYLQAVVREALDRKSELGQTSLAQLLVMVAQAGDSPGALLRETIRDLKDQFPTVRLDTGWQVARLLLFARSATSEAMTNGFWQDHLQQSKVLARLLGEPLVAGAILDAPALATNDEDRQTLAAAFDIL